jgi:hypothetical protein
MRREARSAVMSLTSSSLLSVRSIQRLTTSILSLVWIQVRIKFSRILRDSCKVLLMVTMFVSSLMVRLVLVRLSQFRETLQTQVLPQELSMKCSILLEQ